MKNLTLALLFFSLFSCKKDESIPVSKSAKSEVNYTYKMTVTIAKNKHYHVSGDTLILSVNGLPIYTKNGNVPEWFTGITVKTNDKVSIYYNPGTVKHDHYDGDTDQWEGSVYDNFTLSANFTGGYYNPDFTIAGNYPVTETKLITESRPRL